MALPVLSKTWQFNVNNAQAALGSSGLDNRSLMLAYKNAMIGFGTNPWTVKYSCSSTVAGTAGDGVDRWATVANVVNANSGVAHSWIVLAQTGLSSTFQVCIDYNNGTAAASSASIIFSAAAGFTGGTTTARPTATDEQAVLSNAAWINNNADAAFRWHAMQSTDGQCTRIFSFIAGAIQNVLIFEKFTNATGGSPGATNGGALNIFLTLANFNNMGTWTRQNGTNVNTSMAYESVSNLSIASEVSGAFDIFPMACTSTTTVGTRGRLGTFQDIWIGSSGVATGDSYPASGTTGQFVQVGQIIMPWNTTAFLLT